MATMTTSRRIVKPRLATQDAHGTCGMTLHINGTDYRARPVPCDPHSGAVKCYRLVKQGGEPEVYDVALTVFGTVECTCPDWTYRRADTGTVCKHGATLVALGLLTPPPQRTIPADVAEFDWLEGGAR